MHAVVRCSWAVLSLFVALAGPAGAREYDEALDGDLEHQSLQLDLGLNRVSGVMTGETLVPAGFNIDLDGFYVLLQPGTGIAAVGIEASFVDTTQNTSFFSFTWRLESGSGTEVETVCVNFVGQSECLAPSGHHSIDFYSGPPLAEPIYRFANPWSAGWSPVAGGLPYGGQVHYTIHFDVQAVPEPGTAFLLMLGAGILLLRRLRA